MKITDWTGQDIKETPHKVDVRALYDKESAQAMHILLKPGEALKPHFTPVDVFFFVLEGTPTIQVGEVKKEIGTGMLVESPREILHCIYNYSDRVSRILVVKAPKPTQNARLL